MSFTIEKQVQKGYEQIVKRKGLPFVMKWWAQDYVFLPPKYLVDFKRAGTRDLDFFDNISKAFSLHASVGDLYSSDLMIDIVRSGLNNSIPKLLPLLNEECDLAFGEEIGSCTEWTTFGAADLCGKIMHRTTSRILIGPELCSDPSYLDTSQKLANSIFIHGLIMSMLPFRRSLSSIYEFFLSWIHRRNLERAVNVILPVVQQRYNEFQERRKTNIASPATDVARLDAIEWSLVLSEGNAKEHNPHRIALSLLHNIWAGSAAPAGVVTRLLFEVLMEPPQKYLEPLRAEASAAIKMHGGFTDKALNDMHLMDSLIREINRILPSGAVTCARTVANPRGFRFHDGFELPQGTNIAIPALAIQTDAENFPDPLSMDGFRFARLREAAVSDANAKGSRNLSEKGWGAATVSETNLAFGYGKHACPGRFYAVHKVKLIFSKLILHYDLKWDKELRPKVRPPFLSLNGQFAPNQSARICLRRRGLQPE